MKALLFITLYILGTLGISLLIFSADLRERIWQKVRLFKRRIIQKPNASRYPFLSKFIKKDTHSSVSLEQTNSSKPRFTAPADDDEDGKLMIQPFWHGDKRLYLSLLGAVIVLVITPVIWVTSRNNHGSLEIEDLNDNYSDIENPQIHSLLVGEQLRPPAPPPEELFDQLQTELQNLQSTNNVIGPAPNSTRSETSPFGALKDITPFGNNTLATNEASIETKAVSQIKSADRKWERMNSQYVQRLLVVFKLMKEKYGYDMVLLEGYRSPDRQNRLAAMGSNVTKATGFRSYHQFGLAADCAFIRNGKIVISEREPWAMEGYRRYGELAESVGLTWGGRWKMMDLGHTELRIKGILGNAALAQQMTSGSQQAQN